eukprot:126969-Rhodomonas_salina.1
MGGGEGRQEHVDLSGPGGVEGGRRPGRAGTEGAKLTRLVAGARCEPEQRERSQGEGSRGQRSRVSSGGGGKRVDADQSGDEIPGNCVEEEERKGEGSEEGVPGQGGGGEREGRSPGGLEQQGEGAGKGGGVPADEQLCSEAEEPEVTEGGAA